MIPLYTVSNGVPVGDAGLNIETTESSPTFSRRKFRQRWGVIIHKKNFVPLKEKDLLFHRFNKMRVNLTAGKKAERRQMLHSLV